MINEVINNPKNYAAIYARTSSEKENNSINAQIELAKKALSKKNLLVYSIYIDKVSGRNTAPHLRTGFRKLLEDAKAGCFKTLIIYRLDRLVRNFNHWVQIKETLNKLGIEIIFSDESQAIPSDSPQSEFLQNLTVMVAEMEPDTINSRAENGRKFRRQEGAYNAAKTCPFGYSRELRKAADGNKRSKSIFNGEPIKLAFIKYLFIKFFLSIIEEKNDLTGRKEASVKELANSSIKLIEQIEISLNDLSSPNIKEVFSPKSPEYELTSCINKYINTNGPKFVTDELQQIKFHYFIDAKTLSKKNQNNINSTLRNSIYAGYMLLNSKDELKGLKGNSSIDYEERINEKAFIKTNNLEGIIPYHVFKTVYPYLISEDFGKIDRTPNFILKNKLKCLCGQKLKSTNNYYLHCGDAKCTAFLKKDLLEFVLSQIIDCALSKSNNALNEFTYKINRKIELNNHNIQHHKLNKFQAVAEYLNSTDSSYIDLIHERSESINSYTNLCCEYRKEFSYLTKLYYEINDQFINNNTDSNYTSIQNSKNKIIDYIIDNEELFIPIFDEIIKEIRVIIYDNTNQLKGEIKLKYEFSPKKDSNISKSIPQETKE